MSKPRIEVTGLDALTVPVGEAIELAMEHARDPANCGRRKDAVMRRRSESIGSRLSVWWTKHSPPRLRVHFTPWEQER